MTEQLDQEAKDAWQTRLNNVAYDFSLALKELHDTNPWPERPVLEQAINTVATELWDRYFSQTQIREALEQAAGDLPRYSAGEETRR